MEGSPRPEYRGAVSYSFDGVIGASALTQNLFIIAIGLGIGAMYVRSMTIMLVHRSTLACYRYLERGVVLRHPDPVGYHVRSLPLRSGRVFDD